ncbi:hypothetical protein E2C01_014241 [Portunus trituberculatus]|uniref:Uncharacterized protein n=1 Tax=Portunus trituberculatus TaxID=210409 RepID=A0A5B7DI95_PORTR|nr:hypothetical protein [Portunus trituberculatus]
MLLEVKIEDLSGFNLIVRQKKSNHRFSIVTGGSHLGGQLFVFIHFPLSRAKFSFHAKISPGAPHKSVIFDRTRR